MQQHGKRLTTATASIVGHTGLPAAPAAAAAAARGGTRQGRELLRLSPKIKYKLLPRRCRCATQRSVCKIVERIKKSRMHATTMDNVRHKGKISATPGSSPAFPMPCLPMPMPIPMLMPLFFRRIVLPLSPSCRATLTSVHRQQAASSLPSPSPFSLLACASLPFPCSVVAKCNHCNRFCTISNALGPQDAAPLALCSLLRGCCLLDAAAAAVATVAGCRLPPGVVFIPLRLQLIVARAKARGVFFKKTSTSSTATSTEL